MLVSMILQQQVRQRVRAYWPALLIPLGFMLAVASNNVYPATRSAILFLGGAFLMSCGLPTARRFVNAEPLRGGLLRVVTVVMFLALFSLGPVITVVKAFQGTALPSDYAGAVTPLVLVSLFLPLAVRWAEPKDFPVRRLAGRIRRTAILRTISNGAGLCAAAAFLAARLIGSAKPPLISAVLTLLIAMAVVTHKTFGRTRKLCTETHVAAQTLLRDLARLDEKRREVTGRSAKQWLPLRRAPESTALEQRAARDSWDALKLNLRTTIDTGYRLFGTPLLADSAIDELEKKVLRDIDGAAATQRAREDLETVLQACAARIDVLA